MMEQGPIVKLRTSPKELMALYYTEAERAKEEGRPVAWLTGMAPVEPLRAMGVAVLYPENHAALCGARGMSLELCEAAEAHGYSADLCSYSRCNIGSAITGTSPVGGLPRPDFLLSCSNFCGTVTKWYEALARYFQVPHIHIDIPFVQDDPSPAAISYVVEQLRELITFLEGLLDRVFDCNRLREVLALADQAGVLWGEILRMGRAVPAPLSAFDGFTHMAPMVALRGTQAVVDYYKMLAAEVQERVAMGVASVPGERFRLLWGNIPIWHNLKAIPGLMARYGGCFVASEYANSWAFRLDPAKPLESMALAYSTVIPNLSLEQRAQIWVNLIRDYAVDGFVMHSNRSCKPGSLIQYELKRLVEERTGVSGLLIDADMVDPRCYSEAQINTRLEAFVQTLEAWARSPA
jgi:benzoyl-CoA reductase/2-hydroxyglutaryl-CoA dehydratase subunit BcrC/BadD/HgdB